MHILDARTLVNNFLSSQVSQNMSIFGMNATLGKKFNVLCQYLFLNLFQEDLGDPLFQTNVLIMEMS